MECRLLYLVGQLGLGGAERQLYNLLRAMDGKRYKPAVVVWNFSENDVYVSRFRALGAPLYALPANVSSAAKLAALRDMIRKLKPGVIHSYTFFTNFAAYWAAKNFCAVRIGSIRSNFIRDKKKNGPLIGRLSARWPRTQICNSFASAENVKRSTSLFAPKVTYVVRNGVDFDCFQQFPIPMGRKACIVGIGSLQPVKRWDRLLTAAAWLKDRGLDFVVNIIGDGPMRQSLEQQISDLGLSDRVELKGYAENIPALMSRATFLAHTSETEGLPNVVIEAMACGRPVVAMDAGEIPYLIEEGKTGFVVPRGNCEKFSQRMEILINNPELCCRMGRAARIKAERELGIEQLMANTLSVYQSEGWKEV